MKNIEIVFNKDFQHFNENQFEELHDKLNAHVNLPSSHQWDFGTGCSAISCFEANAIDEIILKLKNFSCLRLKIDEIKVD